MIFHSRHYLPTAAAMRDSHELSLLQFAGIVKVNLERRECYVQTRLKDGTEKLYTMPISSLHDAEGYEVDDEPQYAVQAVVGDPPTLSDHHSTTRYGVGIVNIYHRAHH